MSALNPNGAPLALSHRDCVTVGDAHAWAVTSADDAYRYLLGRTWDSTLPPWIFGMLNPSKARVKDDPTVTKCCGFAKRGGAGGVIVVNAMALSETHPKRLVARAMAGEDAVGPHNMAAIAWAVRRTGLTIAAWGRIPRALVNVAWPGTVAIRATDPDCFGLNMDGSPRHPLMLAYATARVSFAVASDARRCSAVVVQEAPPLRPMAEDKE